MSKNNNESMKKDLPEDFIRIYKYVNFGDKVSIFGKDAVVVEFDPSCPEADTKVVYKEGGFDWVNRDDLEDEQVRLSGLTHFEEETLSVCCGATITNEGLCSDCKEHVN